MVLSVSSDQSSVIPPTLSVTKIKVILICTHPKLALVHLAAGERHHVEAPAGVLLHDLHHPHLGMTRGIYLRTPDSDSLC